MFVDICVGAIFLFFATFIYYFVVFFLYVKRLRVFFLDKDTMQILVLNLVLLLLLFIEYL